MLIIKYILQSWCVQYHNHHHPHDFETNPCYKLLVDWIDVTLSYEVAIKNCWWSWCWRFWQLDMAWQLDASLAPGKYHGAKKVYGRQLSFKLSKVLHDGFATSFDDSSTTEGLAPITYTEKTIKEVWAAVLGIWTIFQGPFWVHLDLFGPFQTKVDFYRTQVRS